MKIRIARRYTTRRGQKFQASSPRIQSDSIHWTAVDNAFRPFDAASLVAMLSVSYDAPDVGARRPSLLVLWVRAVVSPPHGQLTASFVDLPSLLATVHEAIPRVRAFEDHEPDDPRIPIHASIRGHRFRIHPGNLTNPMELLHAVQMTAHATDPFILETKGFSATDVLEVALSYSDWRVAQLERLWPPVDEIDDKQERENTAGDLRVVEARTAMTIHQASPTEWLSRCEYPERAELAWAWATHKAASLRFDMQPMAHTMGPVLAVDSALGAIPIPAAEVLNAVGVALGYLALEARDVPEARRSIQVSTEEFVHRVLKIPFMPDHQAGALITVVAPGSRHVFALGIVATLDPEALIKAVDEATDELMKFDASDLQDERIASLASVYRILLYGGPFRLARWWNGSIIQASVYDFVSIVRDVQQRERTYDLLWEFLMAITDKAQWDGFLAIDFLDAWHHWLEYRVFNPVSAEMAILVNPIDNQQWMRAAAWDPIEYVLYKASVPPAREWAWTHLDAPERATLVDPGGTPVMIATNPPVVIVVPRHELVGWEDLDPAFCTGLGDGILATCTRHARIAEIFRESGGDPTIIVVELADDEDAAKHPGSAGVTVVTDRPRPMIVLRLSSSWLTELIRNPKPAHEAVGVALFKGLALVSTVDLSGFQLPFLEAWNDAPPIAMMGLQESTLKNSFQDTGVLPNMSSAVNHALAQDVATADIHPGTYHGDAMVGIARMLLPILQNQAQTLMTTWSVDAVDVVAEHLNSAHGERTQARQQLGAALSAPWSEAWREEALKGPEGAERTRPLEALLEYLIARDACGPVSPDRFDVGYGRALVNLLLQIGTILASAVGGLAEWTINVTPWRTLTVQPVEPASDRAINWAAYWHMHRADQLRTRDPFAGEDEVPEGFPAPDRVAVAFQSTRSIPDLPQSWKQVDDQMRQAWGTGTDGLAAVLSTAVSWNEDGGSDVVRVSSVALRDEAAKWSGVPTSEIEVAINRLSVDADRLRGEPVPAWEIEHRTYRVSVRPLVRLGDELLLMPWLIHVAQEIYGGYVSGGRFPVPASDTPPALLNALTRFRQVGNRRLERAVADVVGTTDLSYRANVRPEDAAPLGLVIPGEIDLLVVDARRERIWVCEVKDVSTAFAPRAIRQRVDKFWNGDHYIRKLIAKTEAVRDHPLAAGQIVGKADLDELPTYRVIPLMITRRVEPAAFVPGVPVTFVVVDDLSSVLLGGVIPKHGHAPIAVS